MTTPRSSATCTSGTLYCCSCVTDMATSILSCLGKRKGIGAIIWTNFNKNYCLNYCCSSQHNLVTVFPKQRKLTEEIPERRESLSETLDDGDPFFPNVMCKINLYPCLITNSKNCLSACMCVCLSICLSVCSCCVQGNDAKQE